MATPTPVTKGLTTIIWGTEGALAAPIGAIVEGISVTPKYGDPIGDIENGDGASLSLVMLDDGFSARVKVTYDTAKTWPAVGDAVTLNLPKVGAVGGETAYVCWVTSMPPELARKQEAKLEIAVVHRPGIVA